MLSQRSWRRLRPLLWPVALAYWGVSWWRDLFYRIGFFITRKAPVPVVSIGNLSMGGTGKTPATIYVARLLQELDFRVGLLSRGYSRESSGTLLVSDGVDMLASVAAVGDEPFLLAQSLPGAPVVVDEDRYRGALFMQSTQPVDIIVLDDAFQHRGLARDCDLVLLDATAHGSDYRIFPAGLLRESLAGLRRAHLVIWTRTELANPPSKIIARVMAANVPQIHSRMEIKSNLQGIGSDSEIGAAELATRRIAAFCGVARPRTFYQALIQIGLEPEEVRYFPDHHRYSAVDQENLAALAPDDSWALITTDKDAVKFGPDFPAYGRLYVLQVSLALGTEERRQLIQALPIQQPATGED